MNRATVSSHLKLVKGFVGSRDFRL